MKSKINPIFRGTLTDTYRERNKSSKILSHLDILAGRLSAALEFTPFQLQIQIVTHIARHNDVRKAELLRETDIFEKQRILVSNLRKLAVQNTKGYNYSIIGLSG